MLEIIGIIALTAHLSNVAAGKNRTKLWGGLGPLLWIGFEFTGACLGALMNMELGVYLMALVFAIGGGVLAAVIVYALPHVDGEFDLAPATGGGGGVDPKDPWSSSGPR